MNLPINYNKLTTNQRRLVREEYVKRQNGLCFYCGESLDGEPRADIAIRFIDWSLFPKGFLDNPVHLDHNHDTGMTRGAVHGYCNAVMWQYEGM